MGWILPAAILGSSVISGLFGNKNKSSNTGTSTGTSTTTPTFGGDFASLPGLISNVLTKRATAGLPPGYEGMGLAGINSAFRGARMNLNNTLAARGLGASPAAAPALENLEASRAGEMGKFIAGEPLVQNQLQMQAINPLLGLLSMGRGTTGTSTGTGTNAGQTVQGGGIGGAFSDIGGLLGYLLATGKLGGGASGGGTMGPPADLAGLLDPLTGAAAGGGFF